MYSLSQQILQAEEKKTAIGHFNISNIEMLWGIFNAAKSLDMPVIIGVSEGERDFVGTKQALALVHSFRDQYKYPIYLNADHTYSFDNVKTVVDLGYDSVIFDGAKLSLNENITQTKKCVDYAKASKFDILVEAELGYIGTSSKLLDEIPKDATVNQESMPTPKAAKDFVSQTGVDLLSPAVGNIHGMLKHSNNPELNIDLIKEIRSEAGVPLVLHGGSGITDSDFSKAIKSGISIIHISTELRKAWRDTTQKSFESDPDQVAPYKLLKETVTAVQQVVSNRLMLFSQA